ncbi:MAG: mandelate racemase/muconate lactonizing enzyme family protein [Bryobacteraceae bacterium]
MRITAVELLRYARGIRVHAGEVDWLWVRIHTDEGVTGLGETYPCSDSEAGVIRRSLAPALLGRNPLDLDRLWADLFLAVSYHGWAGAEMRAISAIDIALWDLAGKAYGQPIFRLLGGASRESIRVYNTCYDHVDFNTAPVRLAGELLDSGVAAMKIWPYDSIALANRGHHLSHDELVRGAEPLRLIREAYGRRIEVAMEFHGYWNLPCAARIANHLEPYEPMWLEEMLPQDNLAAYRELSTKTRLPLTISERLMTRWGFREVLENRAASVIMPDICWCGGISEAKKIATAAETHYLPVAPHNCGGPILHWASAHLAANLPNLMILETVRRHYLEEYRGLLTRDLVPVNGELPLPDAPGLGVELAPDIATRANVEVERIAAY